MRGWPRKGERLFPSGSEVQPAESSMRGFELRKGIDLKKPSALLTNTLSRK
jgi:hypothetical protein